MFQPFNNPAFLGHLSFGKVLLTDFNRMSTHVELSYAKSLGNYIHHRFHIYSFCVFV